MPLARPLYKSPSRALTRGVVRAAADGRGRWENRMLASYKALNPVQATWLTANPDIEAEFLSRLSSGYLYNTFGPGGQDKSVCDFVMLWTTSGDLGSSSVTKSGAALRWDIDGAVTVQDNLPAHTKGAGAGIITVSTTDGWAGLTRWETNTNPLNSPIPAFVGFTSLTHLHLYNTSVTGSVEPLAALTSLTQLYLSSTSVSGSVEPLAALTSLIYLHLSTTSVSGSVEPLAALTSLTQLNLSGTLVSGSVEPLAALTGLTYLNLSGTLVGHGGGSGLNALVAIRDLRIDNCLLTQTEVDNVLADIYAGRAGYTYATPVLYLGGNNAAPSGTYADEDPPTTGNGYKYELVNDPESDGFNPWTITSN